MVDYISREAAIEALENTDADVCEQYPDGYCNWGISRAAIKAMLKNVPTADVEPVRQQWIPCGERLPDRHKRVLFWATHVGYCYAGYFDHISRSGVVRFTIGGTDSDHVASHWMPLPEPPEEVLP